MQSYRVTISLELYFSLDYFFHFINLTSTPPPNEKNKTFFLGLMESIFPTHIISIPKINYNTSANVEKFYNAESESFINREKSHKTLFNNINLSMSPLKKKNLL